MPRLKKFDGLKTKVTLCLGAGARASAPIGRHTRAAVSSRAHSMLSPASRGQTASIGHART
jgi:hypothetical protein